MYFLDKKYVPLLTLPPCIQVRTSMPRRRRPRRRPSRWPVVEVSRRWLSSSSPRLVLTSSWAAPRRSWRPRRRDTSTLSSSSLSRVRFLKNSSLCVGFQGQLLIINYGNYVKMMQKRWFMVKLFSKKVRKSLFWDTVEHSLLNFIFIGGVWSLMLIYEYSQVPL